MKPICNECNGACCKYVALYCPANNRDQRELWKIRGARFIDDYAYIYFPCPKLKDGICDIYIKRPPYCRLTNNGCKECRILEGFNDKKAT